MKYAQDLHSFEDGRFKQCQIGPWLERRCQNARNQLTGIAVDTSLPNDCAYQSGSLLTLENGFGSLPTNNGNVAVVDFSRAAAVESSEIGFVLNGDPAGRQIVGTSRVIGAKLVSADGAIAEMAALVLVDLVEPK